MNETEYSEEAGLQEPSGSLFDAIVAFFLEDDWSFTQQGHSPVLRVGFQGRHGRWSCFATAHEALSIVTFHSLCPVRVTPEQRQAMIEFISRANYDMLLGNFEMDPETLEIRFKTSIDVEGDRLSPALLKQLVYANVLTVDRYLPGMLAVLFEGLSPPEALAAVEEDDD